ncbi:LutC/YkgG family protein [Paracidobacterium acidisoli]|uniref:LUD domain-containing protein n=1 Tax=Paracidobacterium acidisoli TaxID=2303751 RepID=A0A372IKD9_9BACT|nr:LUD domain-containing protein [Paracidobacterium acidisoli]MBT9332577.1 LUD domain-containing protein [Paracidobacterium acidisoli]
MSGTREAVLKRIRSAIGGSSADAAAREAEREVLPREYRRAGSLDADARLAMFIERLHEYDANVVRTDAARVAVAIGAILQEHGQRSVIVADGFPVEMLPDPITPKSGAAGGPAESFAFRREEKANVEDLDRCDGIITSCFAGIAFTGSIVLTHGPGEGARRFTLLPDRHLCVVRTEQVVETVPEAMDRLAGFATAPITFISGPSATADIEMMRVRGVHGPRFLDVVLVG